MPKIFISYRREDSEHVTGRLYDHLNSHFGREAVFMDVDTIPFGVDFRVHLRQAVTQCDILLAVMGENWLDVRFKDGPKEGQRRLDDPGDFVRIEVQAALERGIPVIPVLVGRGGMPGEQQLPEALKEVAYRNAAEVRSGRDFRDHMERLIRGIEHLAKQEETRRQEEAKLRREKEEEEGRQRLQQQEKEAERQRREEEARRQEEERQRREREQAERQQREIEEKRRLQLEEENRQRELDRLRQEGEPKLAQLVRAALDRSSGILTSEDNAAVGELCEQFCLTGERAQAIISEVRTQWQKDKEQRYAEEQRRREEQGRLQRELEETQAVNLRRLKEDSCLEAWVEARLLGWDGPAWLALVDELRKSEFWPLSLENLGFLLAEIKWAKTKGHLTEAQRQNRMVEVTGQARALPIRGTWYSRKDDHADWQLDIFLPALVRTEPGKAYLFVPPPDAEDADLAVLDTMRSLAEFKAIQLGWCEKITDAGLGHLRNLTQLQWLEVNMAHRITDAGLAHIRNLVQLRSLVFHRCYELRDSGLALLKTLQSLKSLTLWGCRRLTDSGLQHLASLNHLENLALWGCPEVTNAGLATLTRLKGLKTLTLQNCPKITSTGLSEFRIMGNLGRLNIFRCCQIRTHHIMKLKSELPQCRIDIIPAPESETTAFRRKRLIQPVPGWVAILRKEWAKRKSGSSVAPKKSPNLASPQPGRHQKPRQG